MLHVQEHGCDRNACCFFDVAVYIVVITCDSPSTDVSIFRNFSTFAIILISANTLKLTVKKDTESDPTRSPLSPTLAPQTASRPSTASKGTTGKAKATTSRKKSVTSNASKTSSSPRKVPVRRRVEKKGSGSNTSSFYSTPSASSQDLTAMTNSVVDLMDLDCDLTPRQNFLMSGYPGRARHEEEIDEDEVGLILGGMSRSHHDISKSDTGANQLRRAYSFSAGDGLNGNISKAAKPRGNLAVQTNLSSQRYPGEKFPSGSLSAGGLAGKEWNNQDSGSAWDELIEAALAAREENQGDPENVSIVFAITKKDAHK